MRRLIGIIVCLWLGMTMPVKAVSYHPAKVTTPAITYTAPPTEFRSTSAYAGGLKSTGSLGVISAANFASLNSENESSGSSGRPTPSLRRESRPGGSGGMGNVETHSPVGATPCLFLALLAALYVVYKRPRSRASSSR